MMKNFSYKMGLTIACALMATACNVKSAMEELAKDQKKDDKPTAPAVSPYEQIGNTRCLKAWNWKSARAGACSNQGNYTFLDFGKTKWDSAYTIRLTSKRSTGAILVEFAEPSVARRANGKYDLSFTANQGRSTLRMEGMNLFATGQPELGYVVLNGNSGACQAVATGDSMSCYEAFRNGSPYSDNIPLSMFQFNEGSTIQVDSCQLKARNSGSAYSSRALFRVESEKCKLGRDEVLGGQEVEYDLADEANYPFLTKRTR